MLFHTRLPRLALPALLLSAAACGGGGDAAPGAAGDSATAEVVDGVPRDQLQQQAAPLTPDQARAMGIDSAIGPTRLETSDSGALAPPGAARVAPADSALPP